MHTSNHDAAFYHQQGLKLASSGNLAEAIKAFETAARLEPQNAVWQYNCALAWQQLNALPKAIAAYQTALRLKPDFFDAWNNLSTALKAAGEFAAAVEAGQVAVSLRPQNPGAYLNLGNALKADGQFPGAEKVYRQALGLNPSDPRTYLNLANVLRELGRLPEAMALLRQAIERAPGFAEAHRDLGFALLLNGDLPAGWAENEWRWKTEELGKVSRTFTRPRWNGENLKGRTLFAYTEQGFGDAIQFVRYVRLAARQGARVVLECQPALKKLFQSVEGVSQWIVRGEPIPDCDFQLPLLSFPHVLGTTLSTIPNDVPYLSSPAGGILEPIAQDGRLKVGLVWAGNPAHQNDAFRSIRAETVRPLVAMANCTFYSLQIGPRSREVAELGSSVIDLAPRLRDFADTAAAIQQLDLVISVDTAVAHLAGAMAKPVWLLLPFAPDWRWLLGREDSPWYPTMRLFRQETPRDWDGVVQKVEARLKSIRQ